MYIHVCNKLYMFTSRKGVTKESSRALRYLKKNLTQFVIISSINCIVTYQIIIHTNVNSCK
jgi:hypothetical protein